MPPSKRKVTKKAAPSKTARTPATAPSVPPPPVNNQVNRQLSVLEREHAFVRHYVTHRNGVRAVLECGAYNPGDRKSAGVQAAVLLGRPSVQTLLQAAQVKKRQWEDTRYAVTADRIVRELAYTAFSNMQDFVTIDDAGDAHVDLSGLNDPEQGYALGAAVRSIESETYMDYSEDRENPIRVRRTKFSLHDRNRALLELGKTTGDPRFLQGDTPNSNPLLQAQQMNVTIQMVEKILFAGIDIPTKEKQNGRSQ